MALKDVVRAILFVLFEVNGDLRKEAQAWLTGSVIYRYDVSL